MQKIFIVNNKTATMEKGSVLILATLVLGLMLFLGTYFISFTITGAKMSTSQKNSIIAYYLAEAGVQEGIFKLKNDTTWKNAFETMSTPGDPNCTSWSISPFTRDPALFDSGSYTITVDNLGCGQAEITTLAQVDLASGSIAQRIVKTKVFKALGNPVSEFNLFSGGASENIKIGSTDPLNIYGGSIFSNNKIDVEFWSVVNVDNKALANNKIDVSSWPFTSTLNATSCASNVCDIGCEANECPPEAVAMPPLDLSSSDPASYLSLAQNDDCSSIRPGPATNCLFTPEEFESIMWQNYPNLSLPNDTVVYISGDANIRAGQILTVNGVLAADRDINIGEDFCWARSEFPYVYCGSSQVIVNRPGLPADDKPSGLLAERKINTGSWLGFGVQALYIEGLIYSGDEMRLSGAAAPIEIHGGIAARKITVSSMWQTIDIYLESDVIIDTFGNPTYSPVITIDHWEEEY